MGIEEKLPAGFLLTTVEQLAGYMRKSSVWPATFGLACCAIEMMAVGTPDYDIARFGMERFSATPRQADLMIVAGRVSQKMAPVVRQVYDQMPEPKWVISMGVCASSGGMFNNYAIVQGVDHIIPVDVYLPGCPPRPEMLLNAIITLHQQIQNTPLGVNRVTAARAAEEAAMKATPTHAMKGLLADDASSPDDEPARPKGEGRRHRGAEGQPDARPGDRRGRDRGRVRQPAGRARAPRPSRWSSASGSGMFGASTAATPPGTAAWCPRCCSPARPSAPTAATTTRWPTRLERVLDEGAAGAYGRAVERVVVDRGEMTLFVAREHLARRGPCPARRPRAAVRDVQRRVRRALPRRGRPRAARRLPLPVDHPRRQADPRRGHLPRRPTATSPRSSRSTRPTTGTSARPGTCSGSSSTATRP